MAINITTIASLIDGGVNHADDPTGWMKDTKELGGVTVTSNKKVAKPSFWDTLLNGINKFTGGIKLPKVETGADNKTLIVFAAVVLGAVLIFTFGKKRRR